MQNDVAPHRRVRHRVGLASRLAAFLAVLVLVASAGCSSVRPVAEKRSALTTTPRAHQPTPKVIRNKPRHRPTAAQKMNPVFWFGNLDDPQPPEWYARDDAARGRKWHRRNGLHNFTFYVIGIADREFEQTGRFPGTVFHPHGGWNWTVCRYRWLRLPFISYKGRHVVFYVGWRERGNFGVKLNFRSGRRK